MLLFGILLIILIVVVILFLIFYDFKNTEKFAVDTYLTTYPSALAERISAGIVSTNTLNNQLKTDIDNIDIYSQDKDKNMLLLQRDIQADVGSKYEMIARIEEIYRRYLQMFDILNLDTDYNIVPMLDFNFGESYLVDEDLINIEKYLENNVYNNNLSPSEYIKNIPKTSLIYSPNTPVTPETPVINKKPEEDVVIVQSMVDTPTSALVKSAQFF
jgi:hypothetical protein